jgi:hypothetical protein
LKLHTFFMPFLYISFWYIHFYLKAILSAGILSVLVLWAFIVTSAWHVLWCSVISEEGILNKWKSDTPNLRLHYILMKLKWYSMKADCWCSDSWLFWYLCCSLYDCAHKTSSYAEGKSLSQAPEREEVYIS